MLRIQLTDIPAAGLQIDEQVLADSIRPEGVESLPCKELSLSGSLLYAGGDYLFQGTVSGEFQHPCDRCLEQATLPFTASVYWLYAEDAPEAVTDDEEEDNAESRVWPLDGEAIDFASRVWEEAALAVPDKYLCQEGCRGLCARCGINLNNETCTCDTDATTTEEDDNPRGLAALAKLYPDLAPGSNKESNHAGTKEKNG